MVEIASIKGAAAKQKGRIKKAPKVKLTKEQELYVHEFVKLENRIAACREYIRLWMGFFRFFAEDLSQKEITPEEEKGFFQVSTQLARKHFAFSELMGATFERSPDLINVVCTAVSLSNIQSMPENTRSKLELDWHTLYLDMNRSLGRLLRLLPGNQTLSEALASMEKLAPLDAKPLAPGQAGKRSGRSKFLAALLAFPPLGMLGLDCFYLGLHKKGVLRIVTLGGLGLWALIDCFRTLMGKVEDGDGQSLA